MGCETTGVRDIDQQVTELETELEAAGWRRVEATCWRDPLGNLHASPLDAYQVFKVLEACRLLVRVVMAEWMARKAKKPGTPKARNKSKLARRRKRGTAWDSKATARLISAMQAADEALHRWQLPPLA